MPSPLPLMARHLPFYCALVTFSCFAAHAKQVEPIILLDEITVSASTSPIFSGHNTPSITTITADETKGAGWHTLTQALHNAPGTNVIQTGGAGGQTSIFIRGTNANHAKVLVDGIPVNRVSSPNGAYDFGHIPTAGIARIEVLRGPRSGLYGADAIGGVILLTTETGQGSPKATAEVTGGSFGTFNQTASVSGGDDRIDYFFSVTHQRSGAMPVTPPYLVSRENRIKNDFSDSWSFASRLGASPADTLHLSLVTRFADSWLKYTADDGLTGLPQLARQSQRDQHLLNRLESTWTLWDGRITNTSAVGYVSENSENSALLPIAASIKPSVNAGERIVYSWQTDFSITDNQSLILGLQHERERYKARYIDASDNINSAYMEWNSKINDNFSFATNVYQNASSNYSSATTWRFAPTLILPGLDTSLQASIGTSFKAPTLSQRFTDMRPASDFHGNPALRPEKSIGFDIGFEQPLAKDKIHISATYFHNAIKDLINANVTHTSYMNIGKATTQGVESYATLELTDDITIQADYTFTLARDEHARQELLRRPRHKVNFTVSWQAYESLMLSAKVLYVGAWMDGNRDFSIKRLRASGYATVSLAADYQASEQTVLFANIDNLFNRYYENPIGYRQPGLGLFAGLRFSSL